MTKAVINGGFAAWPLSENGEVISVSGKKAVVQGEGTVEFALAKDGKQKTVTVDFNENSVLEIEF